MRWPMQAANVATSSQRVNRVVATLQIVATTFVMHVMVRRRPRQLKMPRPDAYRFLAEDLDQMQSAAAR